MAPDVGGEHGDERAEKVDREFKVASDEALKMLKEYRAKVANAAPVNP